MFAGFDNLDTSNVADILPLGRVKPETVHDVETGLTYRSRDGRGPGERLLDGLPQRDRADRRIELHRESAAQERRRSSYRRGIEADVTYRPTSRLTLLGNASASTNRIREYTDSSGTTPVTYHDVEPLLTPRFITFERAAFDVTRELSLAVETRYTARSFLQNTSDARYVLPAAFDLSANASIHVRRVRARRSREQPHRQQEVRERLRQRRRVVLLRAAAEECFRIAARRVLIHVKR